MLFENIRVQFCVHSRGREGRYTLIYHTKRFSASGPFFITFQRKKGKLNITSLLCLMYLVIIVFLEYFRKVMLKWYGTHCLTGILKDTVNTIFKFNWNKSKKKRKFALFIMWVSVFQIYIFYLILQKHWGTFYKVSLYLPLLDVNRII
jgi:uncharacterized membrane protein YoaK (UPF0700 family)